MALTFIRGPTQKKLPVEITPALKRLFGLLVQDLVRIIHRGMGADKRIINDALDRTRQIQSLLKGHEDHYLYSAGAIQNNLLRDLRDHREPASKMQILIDIEENLKYLRARYLKILR